eukprot:TRINITY_DN18246_c0_g4_i1.p1 TRINITY_DN18246_c0_g4~~TRINITY_DN18246_c0_g4_i1.p1  ORF type:complete len:656 (-),score=150.08 TRINITY_DN18246_c0_g4_i1:163-1923(-)
MATHLLDTATRVGQLRGHKVAQVFIDLRAAFDKVRRDAIFGEGGGLLRDAGIHDEFVQAVKAAHSNTWLGVQGCETVLRTTRGVKAGDPLADTTFIFLVTDIMAKVAETLKEKGYVPHIVWRKDASLDAKVDCDDPEVDRMDLPDVDYVDDIAIVFYGKDVEDLEKQAKEAVEVTYAHFMEVGLEVNFSKGKTEVLIAASGNLKKKDKQHMCRLQQDGIPIEYRGERVATLMTTDKYKHLGTVKHRTGAILPELRRRAALANTAITNHVKLLTAKWLSLRHKKQLIAVLIQSTLLYACQTWPLLTAQQAKVIRKPYYRAVKLALGIKHGHVKDEMLQTYGFEEIMLTVRARRLMYFPRLLCSAPKALLAALQEEASRASEGKAWVDALRNDLGWLAESSPDIQLEDPKVNLEPWENLAKGSRGKWRSIVTKAREEATHAFACEQVGNLDDEDEYLCMICGKDFINKKGCLMHLRVAHGHKSWIKSMLGLDPTCWACGMYYHTPSRLYAHLAATAKTGKVTGCAAQYLLRGDNCSKEEVEQVADNIREEQRAKRREGTGAVKAYAVPTDGPKTGTISGPLPKWWYCC